MKALTQLKRLLTLAMLAAIATVAMAQSAPPIARYVPAGPERAHVFVTDSAHILSPAMIAALQDSALALQASTNADLAWITLPTLGGRPIEEAALFIGRNWRIGSAGEAGDPLRNRGLVVLFVPDRSKTAGSNFRVEVGNGLEGTITDSRSRSITAAMRADLKAKRYDDAYLKGWTAAAALVREDYAARAVGAQAPAPAAATPNITPRSTQPDGRNLTTKYSSAFVIFAFILMVIWMRRRRFGGYLAGYQVNPLIMPDVDEANRRRMLQNSSDAGPPPTFDFGSSGGDSSSSSGGDFGGGGGFSGGGSSDSI